MKTHTVVVREGENCGQVDWSHETAKDMPEIWREAEKRPDDFTFSEYRREIVCICMYDGWPYWTPRPAVCFIGPLNSTEWAFFNSYAVGPDSIRRKASVDTHPEGGDAPQIAAPSETSGAVPKADAQ